MNHYPRHIGDFAAATQGLTLAERGAYTALLDQYYAHELPLPADKRECYRMAVATSATERKAVDYVLGRYFTLQVDGWHQKRADAELVTYREKSAKASQSAAIGWAERKANAMRTHSEGNASHKPIAINQEPVTKNQEPRKAEKQKQARFALPDWIPPDAWAGYEEMRVQKKRPMTDRARDLVVIELTKIRTAGHDPVDALNVSTRSGWTDVYAPKNAPAGAVASLSPVGQRTAANLQRWMENEEAKDAAH